MLSGYNSFQTSKRQNILRVQEPWINCFSTWLVLLVFETSNMADEQDGAVGFQLGFRFANSFVILMSLRVFYQVHFVGPVVV